MPSKTGKWLQTLPVVLALLATATLAMGSTGPLIPIHEDNKPSFFTAEAILEHIETRMFHFSYKLNERTPPFIRLYENHSWIHEMCKNRPDTQCDDFLATVGSPLLSKDACKDWMHQFMDPSTKKLFPKNWAEQSYQGCFSMTPIGCNRNILRIDSMKHARGMCRLTSLSWERINPGIPYILTDKTRNSSFDGLSHTCEWYKLEFPRDTTMCSNFTLIRDMRIYQHAATKGTTNNFEITGRNSWDDFGGCLADWKEVVVHQGYLSVSVTLWVVAVFASFWQIYQYLTCETQRWSENNGVVCYIFLSWVNHYYPMNDKFMQCAAVNSHRGRSSSQPCPTAKRIRLYLSEWMLITCFICQLSFACTDIRDSLANYPCLEYDNDHAAFTMKCSFSWTKNTECIRLLKNERLEGNGHAINLTGISNWEGLVQISKDNDDGPSSLENAPVIRDVHMVGGKTSNRGGFIIQAEQKHFIVEHCSSSGVIHGEVGNSIFVGGGGICGHRCSGDVLIAHCWSSGEIRGPFAGGITGRQVGINGGENNTVAILHCHSTGHILGTGSGGICGLGAGHNSNGQVEIEQCYSVGEIGGDGSGGITGHSTGSSHSQVSVSNCYSRGDITGSGSAGGICGHFTGTNGGIVILTNVYASGQIMHESAGGLIGSIGNGAAEIKIKMSVYDGAAFDMIGGSISPDLEENNSGDLKDITGTVYCYLDKELHQKCWDNEIIWQAVNGEFPTLRDPLLSPTQTPSPTSSGTPRITMTPSTDPNKCTDVRHKLWEYPCLQYNSVQSTFEMTCSFSWQENNDCIVLRKNERFQGNGHRIDLTGILEWEGLVRIAELSNGGPSSLDDAPVIDDVHMVGGVTSPTGGFVIQAFQKHFIVKHCSSSGVIQGSFSYFGGGGGICGCQCSGNILITHCWSSGEILGDDAGGIAGRELGFRGDKDTTVTISHSYSTGVITGLRSGGICGFGSGHDSDGMIIIKQCYSLGEIDGSKSGGIAGAQAAWSGAHVSITNCYSRGNITGSDRAGGICGHNAGHSAGFVHVNHVYASGHIMHKTSGGILGSITKLNPYMISVNMSVYHGETGAIVGGDGIGAHLFTVEKNSGDLDDITDTVYCLERDQNICWNTNTVWRAVDDDFPVLEDMPTPLPSASPSPRSSASANTETVTLSEAPSSAPTRLSYSSDTSISVSSVSPSSLPPETIIGTQRPSQSITTTDSSTEVQCPGARQIRRQRRHEWVELPVQCPPQRAVTRSSNNRNN